jgi:hypothetical protein
VDSLRAGFYDQRERYSKPITTVHEGPMLRQLLVGTAVSVCNIAIHALVMATVVQISPRIAGAKDTVRQSLRSTTVMIATASIAGHWPTRSSMLHPPVLTRYISLS